MQKLLSLILLVGICSSQITAQTIYQTKTAKVKFFSATTVENIEATNSQVNAKMSTNGQVVFIMAIRGFIFKNALMQEHFNENYMESDKFPKANFFGNITNIKSVDFTKDGSYPVTVTGDMEIHGVKQKVTANGTIDVKSGKVSAKSVFKILITNFGIKGSYIGDKIAKEIEITVQSMYE
ncbi:MAG: YceI family protein [Chitinophagaceae bacterium]|jgi:uncharacterized membrane protein